MKEKDVMFLEYNPKSEQKHIYFIWDRNPSYHPDWKNLGMFYGTMLQACKELDKRIGQYKKEHGNKTI